MNTLQLRSLFLDLNGFFASVEQLENPALRGRPVAVVPLVSDHTCVIAASVQAKPFGIKTGTPVSEARRLCPGLVCVPARHDAYVAIHHRVIASVAQVVDIESVCSIDEMACHLPKPNCTVGEAAATAQAVKAQLKADFGSVLTCSIGIASNRFLAKLGSDLQKPDGLVVLDPAHMPLPILGLNIQDLCGVGHNMQRRLNKAGIWTVADLWPLPARHLRRLWGSVAGETFWHELHGLEVPHKPPAKTVIGHSRILDPNLRGIQAAEQVASRLTMKACQRLRRYNFLASRFDLSIRVQNGPRWGRSMRLHPTCDSITFLRLLHNVWGDMLRSLNPQAIKKISIALHGLTPPHETSGDLFDYAALKARALPPTLNTALDSINRKFGAQTIQYGLNPSMAGQYVGTKIAFTRIPDAAEFFE